MLRSLSLCLDQAAAPSFQVFRWAHLWKTWRLPGIFTKFQNFQKVKNGSMYHHLEACFYRPLGFLSVPEAPVLFLGGSGGTVHFQWGPTGPPRWLFSLSLSDFIPAFIPTVPLLYPINLPSPPVQAEAQGIHHEKWHNNAEMGYQHTPAENESVKQQGKQQLFKRSKDLTPTKRKWEKGTQALLKVFQPSFSAA